MRALYVPVRLAATVMAVAAAAGCMSVGDDGSRPAPSHSAGQRGGEAPDGGSAVSGGGAGVHTGRKAKGDAPAKPGESASGTASPSASEGTDAEPSALPPGKGGKGQPGPPGPTKGAPSPAQSTADPTPPPPPPPSSAPPSPGPTTAEPSSSAHEQSTQLVDREPAPRAGQPA